MRPVTLLWALRSPCNLGCRYCYFGTIEDHRLQPAVGAGELSHLSRSDLNPAEVFAFAETLVGSAVGRIFLAGGEPLIWPPVIELIRVLKDAGIEVVVCTNGIPLNRAPIRTRLIDLSVDAVSVSLDSAVPDHHDQLRPARNGHDDWHDVIAGVRALVDARGNRSHPKIGLYTVITRRNLDAVTDVPALGAGLGCDFAVPQLIALDTGHPLHGDLSLRLDDLPKLTATFDELYRGPATTRLPAKTYPERIATAVRHDTGTVHGCFGGHTLFFIEPDGSVWDCPSSLRIQATTSNRHRTIRGVNGADLFGPPEDPPADCPLFSRDCVNMWPLMDFGKFLEPSQAPTARGDR